MSIEAQEKIDEEFGKQTGLLDLRNCSITEIPIEVGQMSWLEILILSNKIDYDEYFNEILIDLNLNISYHDNILVTHKPNLISELPTLS